MKKWIAKALVQKAISYLPFRERVNYLFQKYVTKGVDLTDEHFGYKIQHAKDHIQYLLRYGDKKQDNLIVELGTGWYPVVPICIFLQGVGRVISIDIRDWTTKAQQLVAINKFLEWADRGMLAEYLPNPIPERWEILKHISAHPDQYSKSEINELIGLTTLVADARHIEAIDNQSIDFICSNNTFEHIYPEILRGILRDFARIIKPGGVMSHFIDLSDHFAHFDHSITIYNFLRFSDRSWELIDNVIQPQNRLRFKAYKLMYQELGIPITAEDVRPGSLDLLAQVPVHPALQEAYTREELAISHGYLVSKFPPS